MNISRREAVGNEHIIEYLANRTIARRWDIRIEILTDSTTLQHSLKSQQLWRHFLNLAARTISLNNVPEQRLDQKVDNLVYGRQLLVDISLLVPLALRVGRWNHQQHPKRRELDQIRVREPTEANNKFHICSKCEVVKWRNWLQRKYQTLATCVHTDLHSSNIPKKTHQH